MNGKACGVGIALVVQIVAIGWLIARYERIVSRGTEVRFACQAYDPYDPFRGRYLRVNVREMCTNFAFTVTRENMYGFRNKLHAKLEPDGTNRLWRVACVADRPQGEGVWVKPARSSVNYGLEWSHRGTNESWEAFNSRRSRSGFTASVNLPDQLFVNEKLAPKAEQVMRKNGGKPTIAVYRVLDGEMVLTDLEVEGKSIKQIAREVK